MAKVITVANQKSGVGKTTTTGALAAGLTRRGYKVLAVDLDAQGNLSNSVGVDEQKSNVYELMKGTVDVRDTIQQGKVFRIIPSDLLLASADMEFTQIGREYKLKKAILPLMKEYDYIIFDTPPTLGIMTVNAFIVSDEVIIPASGFDGIKGITNLYSTINTVRDFGKEKLQIAGILLTMFNPRADIDQNIKELAAALGEHLEIQLFDTFIRSSEVDDEAKANGVDLLTYDAKNNVSIDYDSFIDEYLKGAKQQ